MDNALLIKDIPGICDGARVRIADPNFNSSSFSQFETPVKSSPQRRKQVQISPDILSQMLVTYDINTKKPKSHFSRGPCDYSDVLMEDEPQDINDRRESRIHGSPESTGSFRSREDYMDADTEIEQPGGFKRFRDLYN